ncbi:MAG: hypothetical protein IJ297_02580 [Clostridia bacterium]|nr:hypothetical protein [Clostridia bacterium]
MGYVKDWSEIIGLFFEDMLFTAYISEGENAPQGAAGALDKYLKDRATFTRKLFKGEDAFNQKSIAHHKRDYEGEIYFAEDKRLNGLQTENLQLNHSFLRDETEKLNSTGFFEEAFEKAVPLGEESLALAARREKLLKGAEEMGSVIIDKRKADKILAPQEDTKDEKPQYVRVEMVKGDSYYKETDIDETIELIGERLCEMMAKGADGLYV